MLYALQVFVRWLHISSAVVLIGGAVYWRLILMPSSYALPAGEREILNERDAGAFRPFVLAAIAGLILSGIFNILARPGHSLSHNVMLAVKLLLVAHVFAAALVTVRAHSPRRTRTLTGTVISGAVILAISAYLRVVY
ncbi:MAG: hypothetical protein LAQ30_07980 [Acidobacteriia bacterium]|nr:hypothetical protein [Terriglobia bacterium]